MSWRQRPAHTSMGTSPSDEFHGCLDALIVTIREMRGTVCAINYVAGGHWTSDYARECVLKDIRRAEERAAVCAGLLFDRWIEESDDSTIDCF